MLFNPSFSLFQFLGLPLLLWSLSSCASITIVFPGANHNQYHIISTPVLNGDIQKDIGLQDAIGDNDQTGGETEVTVPLTGG